MVKVVFPEHDEIPYSHDDRKMCEKDLSEAISTFGLPENPDKFLISTRRIPTCLEYVLHKKVKAYKGISALGSTINKKYVTACAMKWALSKLYTIPEYKNLIDDREEKQCDIKSADEARQYRSRNSKGLFKRVREMEDLDHPYVLQSDESLSNRIGELAPMLMMSNYEFAIFLLCLGLRYGDGDESQIDEKYRLKQWEIDNLMEIVQFSQEHLLTLADDIKHFEYQQSIKGMNLFA